MGTEHVAIDWERGLERMKAYKSLAWTESLLALPGDYEEEVRQYTGIINKQTNHKAKSMLHLGCGAGGHDRFLKADFDITGVDLNEEMLTLARKANPKVTYLQGDMRSVRLDQQFDVVIVPDAIAYMNTEEDLEKALETAAAHLKTTGLFMVVTHTREEFRNNNFVYTGSDGQTHLTLFENNHIIGENQYEATMIYLIRQHGKLTVDHDVHSLGMFSHETWCRLLEKHGLKIKETFNMDQLYDEYVMKDGEYRLKVYLCEKEPNT